MGTKFESWGVGGSLVGELAQSNRAVCMLVAAWVMNWNYLCG